MGRGAKAGGRALASAKGDILRKFVSDLRPVLTLPSPRARYSAAVPRTRATSTEEQTR